MIRWWQIRKRAACPHSRLRGIYGDEIRAAGYKRLHCLDCGRLLDGPVVLAKLRSLESVAPIFAPIPEGSAAE